MASGTAAPPRASATSPSTVPADLARRIHYAVPAFAENAPDRVPADRAARAKGAGMREPVRVERHGPECVGGGRGGRDVCDQSIPPWDIAQRANPRRQLVPQQVSQVVLHCVVLGGDDGKVLPELMLPQVLLPQGGQRLRMRISKASPTPRRRPPSRERASDVDFSDRSTRGILSTGLRAKFPTTYVQEWNAFRNIIMTRQINAESEYESFLNPSEKFSASSKSSYKNSYSLVILLQSFSVF